MTRVSWCLLTLLIANGCGSRPDERFHKLADEFVYGSLAASPVTATSAGLHQYQGQNLDELLDDYSPDALGKQRKFYERFRSRLEEIKPEQLDPEDRADYGMIRDQIALALLDFDEIQTAAHNPTMYVELIGNALFNPLVLDYAPKNQRLQHIVARLARVPMLVDQAKLNLTFSPPIWTKVAQEENAGNIDLIDREIRRQVPPEMKDAYDKAAKPALDALNSLQDYFKNSLSARTNWDWRLGGQRYARKFRYVLATDRAPDVLLAEAETGLSRVRAQMLEMALPLHRKMFPAHKDHAGQAAFDRENQVISEVLDRIADRHSTPESYIPDARGDLDEARRFTAEKKLLTLPSRGNLQVIETPAFMRGVYGVGGFASAPPLEPQLGAFYWVTPISRDWSKERAASKLREYNFYKLKLLTIHEAMPGHYVQSEYANDVQPQLRRVVRALYGSGPYVEGWAQYITQSVLDHGFLDNAPELWLTFQKETLRVLANAILDIRLHTLNMSDEEAIALMMRSTFQEKEEATAKLQRAKLSSCQLPTYYVGWLDWLRVRDQVKEQPSFNLTEFHDRALKAGPVPLTALAELITGKPLDPKRSAAL